MDVQSDVQVYKSTDWHEPMYIDPRIRSEKSAEVTFEVKPATATVASSSLKLDSLHERKASFTGLFGSRLKDSLPIGGEV